MSTPAPHLERYRSALSRYASQDFAGACEEFTKAVRLEPGFADAYHGLAHALEKLDDLEAALAAARRAVELSPEEVLMHTTLSVICRRQGLIAEAEAAQARAAELQRQQDGP